MRTVFSEHNHEIYHRCHRYLFPHHEIDQDGQLTSFLTMKSNLADMTIVTACPNSCTILKHDALGLNSMEGLFGFWALGFGGAMRRQKPKSLEPF